MKLSSFLSMLVILGLLFSSLFHVLAISASSSLGRRPLCHDHESLALLQFKQSFAIDKSASSNLEAYPKVETWKLQGGRAGDCCYWDGVECDDSTGHVIGLDLSSSCLHGSIDSTSSLFHLVHLHTLNLADNNFSYSQIPSSLGNLSKLSYLNFSYSIFSGPIPSEISKLSKLVSLDLSSLSAQLTLETAVFRKLLQNLTSLEVLHLRRVYIASSVPDILANLSSLTSLGLTSCQLFGEFPPTIFQLPNLQFFDLRENLDLAGHLPEFNVSSSLLSLLLGGTSFAGEIPTTIGNLLSLEQFDTWYSGFSGKIPASLLNLTQLNLLRLWGNPFEVPHVSFLSWIAKLTKVTNLALRGFRLNSEIPSSIANLTQLNVLALQNCQLTGEIPAWLLNMTQLVSLRLSFNELQGRIPQSISQLTQLTNLFLRANNLHGPIPSSIFQLTNLEHLSLGENKLSGIVELDMFLKLPKLTMLFLSRNQLSVHAKVNTNTTLRKFVVLGLGYCNLSQLPDFLRDQDELLMLELSQNNIHGPLPEWLWSISKDTLQVLDLSGNFLTNVRHNIESIAWVQLLLLDLSNNMLQGSLPIPPQTIRFYIASGNNFSGELPSSFCGLKSLSVLGLSHNNLSGVLPQCLGNLSNSLEVLDLEGNKFQGKILSTPQKDCNLKMLKLGQNRLEGRLPKSLANCGRLDFLDVGKNQIDDVFPAWLGALRELKVLILRSNRFHGALGNHQANFSDPFPMLRIVDLSQNNLSGQLSAQYLLIWKAMKLVDADRLSYMQTSIDFLGEMIGTQSLIWSYMQTSIDFFVLDTSITQTYSMLITNKGVEREYSKILEYFVAIDLSGNKFEGEIPELVGNLHALRLLNLSNNILNGSIPSSLGSLTKLESLDLSRNKLSGRIPQQLIQLGFLAVFDVSYNNLTGSIPGGKQFDTFDNSSYKENLSLCGSPLSRKCGNSKVLPPSSSGFEEGEEWGSSFAFGWKPVTMGYAFGLLVGLVIGLIVTTWKYDWFLKTFRVRPSHKTRYRSRRN